MLLKPEEVSKKTKKSKVLEVLGLGVSQFLVFLRPPQVLAMFSLETLPKPEEVSKKPKIEKLLTPRPPKLCFFWFF